jgi:outer membrane receptor for Fe3+-dicitrate
MKKRVSNQRWNVISKRSGSWRHRCTVIAAFALGVSLCRGEVAAQEEADDASATAEGAAVVTPEASEASGEEFGGLLDFGTLDPTLVIGSSEAIYALPGSGFFIEPEDIQRFSYLSVNRVLAKVPGVYVREEDGFGNFPNISIRGGDGTRSENVTLMEDGILSAPAPYSAPAAYYSPNGSRMSGIEVLKGSSQVRYGPHTTGGVINYLSTLVPEEQTFYLRSTYGTDNTVQAQAYYGDVVEGKFGRIGFVLELYHKRSDGFRTIDSGIGYGGSDDTGFTLTEPMVKVFWEPASASCAALSLPRFTAANTSFTTEPGTARIFAS